MSELWHYGKKGMKWGVVKEDAPTGGSGGSSARSTSGTATRGGGAAAGGGRINHDLAKKLAIGAGVTAVVAGGAFVTYKLNKSGAIKLKDLDLRDPTGLELRPDFAESRKKMLDQVSLLDKTRAVTEATTRKSLDQEMFDRTPNLRKILSQDPADAMKTFDEFMLSDKPLKLGTAGKGSSRFQRSLDDKLAEAQVKAATTVVKRVRKKERGR